MPLVSYGSQLLLCHSYHLLEFSIDICKEILSLCSNVQIKSNAITLFGNVDKFSLFASRLLDVNMEISLTSLTLLDSRLQAEEFKIALSMCTDLKDLTLLFTTRGYVKFLTEFQVMKELFAVPKRVLERLRLAVHRLDMYMIDMIRPSLCKLRTLNMRVDEDDCNALVFFLKQVRR